MFVLNFLYFGEKLTRRYRTYLKPTIVVILIAIATKIFASNPSNDNKEFDLVEVTHEDVSE